MINYGKPSIGKTTCLSSTIYYIKSVGYTVGGVFIEETSNTKFANWF